MKNVIVHQFRLSDVEEPMYEWEKSEEGQFVMKNSLEVPVWHRYTDPASMTYEYKITAFFDDKTHTFWSLKFK